MKIKDIRALSTQELESKIGEIRSDLMKKRAESATGTQSKNPKEIKTMRKTIAKMFTIMKEKEGTNKQ